jgi:protein SCO1
LSALRFLLLATIVLIFVGPVGCSGGNVEHGEAGSSSGYAPDAQELAAGEASAMAGGSLADVPGTFTDQDGATHRLSDFRGRPLVASAIYTRCVTVCPRVVEELRALEHAWRADTTWHGVLFSLDPTYDRPPILHAFAAERGLSPSRWTLLVPDSAALDTLARTLGLFARDDPSGGIAHTALFARVDEAGQITDRRTGISLPRGGLAAVWKRPAGR